MYYRRSGKIFLLFLTPGKFHNFSRENVSLFLMHHLKQKSPQVISFIIYKQKWQFEEKRSTAKNLLEKWRKEPCKPG